jgi:hypothetical protein
MPDSVRARIVSSALAMMLAMGISRRSWRNAYRFARAGK